MAGTHGGDAMSDATTGSGPGDLGGSTGAGVAGGASGAPAAGGVGGVGGGAGGAPNGGVSRVGRLLAGVLPEHDHETPSTGGDIDYLRTRWGTDHLADPEAHAQYVDAAELATALAPYATDADLAGYLTPEAGDDLFLTPAEGDAAYAAVDHTHPSEQSGPWRFQDTAGTAGPGAGYLRANTGVLATATLLLISRTTQDGYDIPPPGWGLAAGDTIYAQDRDDSTKWVRYAALEPLVRYATYATGLVAVLGHAGATIVNGQLLEVTFSLAGGGGTGTGSVLTADPLWDAKGDLVAATGADAAARLAVGADGTLLAADSAQATGVGWVANPVPAHAALPDAHHARAHDHTAADGSGVLSNDEHDGYSQYANLGTAPATPATNRIRLYARDNGGGVATLYYRTEDGTIYELPTLNTGGGNGSGAPANAGYVTLAAESKLSQEAVLGTAVVMTGTLAARPASGTAGRLYLATDTDLVYRDSGAAWATFATRKSLATDPLADARGDVFAASGADAVGRLPLGTDGQVLTADSAQALGVKWAAGGGGGLPTAGGTMTGTVAAQGAAVDAGGALAVTSPNATVVDARVYGPTSPAYTPASGAGTASHERGLRFTATAALYLVAVRWWRLDAGRLAPLAVRLWDETAPATPVWSLTTPAAWNDTTAGWREHRLAAGTQPLLVSGRQYVLSFGASTSNQVSTPTSYAPVPDGGLTFNAYVDHATAGTHPTTTTTGNTGIDGAFRTSLALPNPAQSGTLRLPNGAGGALAWRNSVDGADLSLTMDAADRPALAVGATAVTTSATAGAGTALPATPAVYLSVVVNGTAYKLPLYLP
jgi:hypothetical protein